MSAMGDVEEGCPPDEYLCPITHNVMREPVLLLETGHTYERWAIVEWFSRGRRNCPKTGVVSRN